MHTHNCFISLLRVSAVRQIQVLFRPRHHHRDLAADVQLPEVVIPAAKRDVLLTENKTNSESLQLHMYIHYYYYYCDCDCSDGAVLFMQAVVFFSKQKTI
jgi:hypothetical protein